MLPVSTTLKKTKPLITALLGATLAKKTRNRSSELTISNDPKHKLNCKARKEFRRQKRKSTLT